MAQCDEITFKPLLLKRARRQDPLWPKTLVAVPRQPAPTVGAVVGGHSDGFFPVGPPQVALCFLQAVRP